MKNKGILICGCTLFAALLVLVIALLIKPWDKGDDSSQTTTKTTTTASVEGLSPDETPAGPRNTPVLYHGEILAQGNKLVGSKTGEVVRVTGMSFFWSNWSQKYYTADYVDYLVDEYGCEVVRCSYGIQDNGQPYDRSCEALIENVIDRAIERGVYVIVDWHSHGAHNNTNEAVAYFEKLAQKYGEYDNVIFEVFNEPTQISWSTVKTYSETVIAAIRKYSDNLVIVGSPQWSQKVEDAAANPIDAENIAYTLHFYAGTHKEWLRQTADRAMAAGIPIFVTEWGSVNADGNGAIAKQSTEEWFAWMDKNNISSCNWAVNDKNEGSSIFSQDKTLSDTGLYIKELIWERTKNAAWRTAN
jgi:endoglucanase